MQRPRPTEIESYADYPALIGAFRATAQRLRGLARELVDLFSLWSFPAPLTDGNLTILPLRSRDLGVDGRDPIVDQPAFATKLSSYGARTVRREIGRVWAKRETAAGQLATSMTG